MSDTQNLIPSSTTPDSSLAPATICWWLWISWIEREGGGGFVYGCAARNFHPACWSDDAAFEIPGGGRLVGLSQKVAIDCY
jgi:hypothetical protein